MLSEDKLIFLKKYFVDEFKKSNDFKKVIAPYNKDDFEISNLLNEIIGFNPLNLSTIVKIDNLYVHVVSVYENYHQTNYYVKQTNQDYFTERENFVNEYKKFVDTINEEVINPRSDLLSEKIKNPYIVRNWMVSEVSEFSSYDEAKIEYDMLKNESEEIDIQLYKLLEESNNID